MGTVADGSFGKLVALAQRWRVGRRLTTLAQRWRADGETLAQRHPAGAAPCPGVITREVESYWHGGTIKGRAGRESRATPTPPDVSRRDKIHYLKT